MEPSMEPDSLSDQLRRVADAIEADRLADDVQQHICAALLSGLLKRTRERYATSGRPQEAKLIERINLLLELLWKY